MSDETRLYWLRNALVLAVLMPRAAPAEQIMRKQ
jgi:hypothetical protein